MKHHKKCGYAGLMTLVLILGVLAACAGPQVPQAGPVLTPTSQPATTQAEAREIPAPTGEPTVTPMPTETPIPPSVTPQATDAPAPTVTPVSPSATPPATDTPEPTVSPEPTAAEERGEAATAERVSGPALRIIAVDKKAEFVTIQNVGNEPVNLRGWTLVSERGHQDWTVPFDFVLEPGAIVYIHALEGENDESNLYSGFSSTIWNNSKPDPAVLLDPAGTEVSRYP